jgi:hypothetical protein
VGLLDDTIRDARRPLAGAWVRRAAADEPEISLPDADDLTEGAPSGMQTVFRFQKAESPALPGGLREASYQPGADARLPAGDPLSAGTEDESPKPPAKNVAGDRDISVKSHSRTSILETGQEEHASPSRMAVANAGFESATVQSVVSSGPVETESYREQQSNIPAGSERPVSRSGETYRSRPTGRGAPSEAFSVPSKTLPSTPAEAPPVAPRTRSWKAGEASPSGAPPEAGGAVAGPAAVPAELLDVAEYAAAHQETVQRPATARGTAFPEPSPVVWPATPPGHGTRMPPLRSPFPGTTEPAQPGLVIGRIDVVVVAGNAQPQSPSGPRADSGFLSRNYLKRL